MRLVGPKGIFFGCIGGGQHPIDRVKVIDRMCNYSAFNGYHYTPSDYSSVTCTRCGSRWRTKANYVATLSDIKAADV